MQRKCGNTVELSGKELDDEYEKVGLKKCIEVLDFCEVCLRVYRARTPEK